MVRPRSHTPLTTGVAGSVVMAMGETVEGVKAGHPIGEEELRNRSQAGFILRRGSIH